MTIFYSTIKIKLLRTGYSTFSIQITSHFFFCFSLETHQQKNSLQTRMRSSKFYGVVRVTKKMKRIRVKWQKWHGLPKSIHTRGRRGRGTAPRRKEDQHKTICTARERILIMSFKLRARGAAHGAEIFAFATDRGLWLNYHWLFPLRGVDLKQLEKHQRKGDKSKGHEHKNRFSFSPKSFKQHNLLRKWKRIWKRN